MSKITAAITGVHGFVPDYVLTNKELKQFRIDDGDAGKVGITFISINDGCTVLAEIDEDDLEELE